MKTTVKLKKHHYILGLLLLVVLYTAGNAISICIYSTKDETRNADTAIILGAAATDEGVSPVFRERINHGIWLYQNGYVKKLIITGGYGEGNHYSDSYIGKQYAIGQGIPEDAILLEEASTITEENLENAKDVMKNNRYDTALIVSDPLHMKRSMRMARDKGLNAYTSPTRTSMYRSLYEKTKFTAREVFFYIGYKFSFLLKCKVSSSYRAKFQGENIILNEEEYVETNGYYQSEETAFCIVDGYKFYKIIKDEDLNYFYVHSFTDNHLYVRGGYKPTKNVITAVINDNPKHRFVMNSIT